MNEIRITDYNEKTPFKRWNIVRKSAVEFSEDPKFRINGKDISIREFTNQNAVDTNIYEVIEKYRGDLKMSATELNQFHTELAEELSEIKSMPDALMQMNKAKEAWRNLPLDVRQDFGNSIQKFVKYGSKYLNEKITAYNKKIEEAKKLNTRVETTTETAKTTTTKE